MTILVTRPSPQGEELVSRLRAQGRVAWSFPLIDFTPGRELNRLAPALSELREGDLASLFCYRPYHGAGAPSGKQP